MHKTGLADNFGLVDENGNPLSTDIDKWYKWQRKCVAEEVKSDNFEMSLEGSLCELRIDKLLKSPKDKTVLTVGKVTLTNKGLYFDGMLNGEKVDFNFDAQSVYSLTFSTQGYLEFYYKNDYYMIVPSVNNQCLIKWTLASEEIHNIYDEKWKRACLDVYAYNEGDTNE